MTKSLDARAATPLVSMSSAPVAPVQLFADNVARIAAPTFVSATTSSATFDVRIPSPAPAGLLPFVDGVAQPHITVTEAAGALQRITVANLPAGTRSVALAPLYDLTLEVKGERSIETPIVVAGAPAFVLIGPSSVVLGNSPAFTFTADGVDVTANTNFTTSDPTVLAIDAPTLATFSPGSLTQGTSAGGSCTGTNLAAGQTLGGLPTGVSMTAWTPAGDGNSATFTLTAASNAVAGVASVFVRDTGHGNSGTKALTIASSVTNLLTAPNDLTNAAWAFSENGNTVANVAGVTLPDGSTGTVSQVTFAGSATAAIQQPLTIAGGTGGKSFTLTGYVRMVSGSGVVAFKNTQGGVADHFSADMALTTAWRQITFQVTDGASAGTGVQILGVINGSTAVAKSVYITGLVATTP